MVLRYLLFLFPFFLFSYKYRLNLGANGSICYIYDDLHLLEVKRLSEDGEEIYFHCYHYNKGGYLISERLPHDLGEIVYEEGHQIRSPYSFEKCQFDQSGNLIKHTLDETTVEYSYSNLDKVMEYKKKLLS